MNDRAHAAFLRACALDVLVRKPGNVSVVSPGHGMDAAMFVASAEAAAGPLFQPGASVGQRIEAAVDASWAVAHCNTNLGIVLLCAPIARALELRPEASTWRGLQEAIEAVLAALDLQDTRAAYRAIARANPGGLGAAAAEDVHAAPSLDLRAAMALAAERDSIARQYRDGFAELVDLGQSVLVSGFAGGSADPVASPPSAETTAGVQSVFLAWLGAIPDSHIVRKRGDAAAQTVMRNARACLARAVHGEPFDIDRGYAAWDEALKREGINPGTSADLTVATLMLALLVG